MLHKVSKSHNKFVSGTFVIAMSVTSATLWSQAYTHTVQFRAGMNTEEYANIP